MMFQISGRSGHAARAMAAAGFLALCAAVPALAQTPAPAPATQTAPIDPNTVVATIDGQPLTEREVQAAVAEIGPSLGGALDPEKRDQIIGFLIDIKLAARAAEKEKLADTPEFQTEMAFLRDKALMQALLDKRGKDAVTEQTVKQIYDDTVKDLKPEQEVHARHILVETEDEAKAVEERLKKGEDFAVIAKEVSKDPGSGAQGGDLGFFTKDQMVPEFADQAFKLEPGKISDPVKSQFGWHVIKVEEKREKPIPTLDQVRDQIEQYANRRAQQEAIQKLRSDAKIERKDAPAQPDAPKPAQ
ncbi:peptidylprolyl isomerase [Flaviflagellibacter deserti]|uniref:Parvulin-like PPIase n=1 Tax=Flaviflagellibacter deserti TaxID=2267266 RepID=A0ABV9YYA7_9HYPH